MMKGYVMLLFGWTLKAHQQKMEEVGSISASEAVLPVMIRYIRENYTTVTLTSVAKHFEEKRGLPEPLYPQGKREKPSVFC